MKNIRTKAKPKPTSMTVRYKGRLVKIEPCQEQPASSLPERLEPPQTTPRPTDAELAERLRGTNGRCFVKHGDLWLDPVTGATGTREELERAWLAER